MSSPFVVSPIAYGDIASGATPTIGVIAARAPSNTIDKQFPSGTFWLNSRDMYLVGPGGVITYGDGSLYYQSGNSAGVPGWAIISDGSSIVSVNGTTNQITVTNAAGVVTLSIPAVFIAPGSIAATTTLTASLGNITATNGNLVLGTAGNKLQIHSTTASSDSVGTSAAMAGTPGTVTITTSACTTSSTILFSRATTGGTAGQVSITSQLNGSFVLTSTGNETSTFNYLIIN